MAITTHGRFILLYSLNFLSAILLIYMSKWLFRQSSISSLTLTIFNCLSSGFLATIVLPFLHKSSPLDSPVPHENRFKSLFRILLITGSFSAFITFSNLSLQYNTLGTYQLIKLQIPPTLMLLEWLELQVLSDKSFQSKKEKFYRNYSYTVALAFGIMVLGTLLNTYSDLYFHPLGVTYACLSVICNALYQTLVQSDRASSIYERTRFLQIQSLVSAAMLFPCWSFVENSRHWDFQSFFAHRTAVMLLFACGLLAFLVNTSLIWCIKDDSAIGYNMVGQLKTLLIIFIGSILFGELLTVKQIICVLCTTTGCLIYVYITYKTKERQKSHQPQLLNNQI